MQNTETQKSVHPPQTKTEPEEAQNGHFSIISVNPGILTDTKDNCNQKHSIVKVLRLKARSTHIFQNAAAVPAQGHARPSPAASPVGVMSQLPVGVLSA